MPSLVQILTESATDESIASGYQDTHRIKLQRPRGALFP